MNKKKSKNYKDEKDKIKSNKKDKIEKRVSQLENIPEELKEFVKDAPPEVRKSFMAMMRTQSRQIGVHPLFEKLTPEHVDKFLDYCHKDDQNAYKLSSSNRWFYLGYTFIFVAFLTFLIVYLLPSNEDMLSEILKILISLAGGFGIGYGWKSYKEK